MQFHPGILWKCPCQVAPAAKVSQNLGAVLQKPETFSLQSKRLGSDDVSQTSKSWPFLVNGYTAQFGGKTFVLWEKDSYQQQKFCPENKVPLNKRLHEYLMSISDKARVRSVIMALLKTCMNMIRAATKIYFKLKFVKKKIKIKKHHNFTEPTEMSSKYFVWPTAQTSKIFNLLRNPANINIWRVRIS